MRKAHGEAIRLLLDRRDGKLSARDKVQYSDMAGSRLAYWFYHGNPIARVDEEGVFINWQGWFNAPSTSQRIYALCAYVNADRPDKEWGWIKIA